MLVRPPSTAASTFARLDAPPGEGPAAAQAVRATGSRAAADPLTLAGLGACVEEVGAAALRRSDGPPDPTAFASLRRRLERAATALPEPYRRAVAAPLLATLTRLGPSGFAKLLARDPDRVGEAALLLDVAQAVLQRGEGHEASATAAFQEVVADLYDGFLAAEGRRGVKPPEGGVLPPLVRWGSAEAGPYTWPVSATAALGVGAPVVSLPAANARDGLLAWAAVAHETVGHDLLGADRGLRDELARAVEREARAAGTAPALATYWAERIEESASDVMGVLNTGPAAAVGLIGYFRGVLSAWSGQPTLRADGDAADPHPADLARAYLAAETVRLLPMAGAARWADRLEAEVAKDGGHVLHLGGVAVTPGVARDSAAAVARAIVTARLQALEGHALGEVRRWGDADEALAAGLRAALGRGASAAGLPAEATAAHLVAAAVYEAVGGGTPPGKVLDRMIDLLGWMHARNPAWAPGRAAA